MDLAPLATGDVLQDRLYRDPALARFYDLENGWGPDFDYCRRLAEAARTVLDLGCGTGRLAADLGEGRDVVGVDPAAAMLDIARRRPGGHKVAWVQADARTVRLGRRFDLVLLTGHAFQVFLTDDDQRAALSTIAAHLAPGGRFIFDTRNPAVQAWRRWTPGPSKRRLEPPGLGGIEAWNDVAQDAATGIITYWTHYRVVDSGEHSWASSRIRFTSGERLAAMLADSGLAVDQWLGDWTGGACGPASAEIIPLGRLAESALARPGGAGQQAKKTLKQDLTPFHPFRRPCPSTVLASKRRAGPGRRRSAARHGRRSRYRPRSRCRAPGRPRPLPTSRPRRDSAPRPRCNPPRSWCS